jgi:hypothetical protein
MPTEINFPENDPNYTPLSDFFVGKQVLFDRVRRFSEGKRVLLTQQMHEKKNFKDESRFVQYSKLYFEAIIQEMTNYGADGLRIYFAEYEDSPTEPAFGQLGLIMLLTKTNEKGQISPVYLDEIPDFQAKLNNTRSRGIDMTITDENGKPKEINVCRPCPPACPDQEPGFPEDELS